MIIATDEPTIESTPESTHASTVSADETDFPCSLAQERFWLLDRLEPGNPSYNVAVRWRLEGTVSSALLERTWLRILERHEVLRTVFVEADGLPLQRVLPHCPFRLAEIDLGNLPEDARQTEGDRIGAIEARAPFDVVAGPLIRVTLLRFSATVSVILVTTHQIVSDGWSIGIMAREMGEIYRALRNGQADPLEEIPLQYADYSQWQLEWLRARGTEAETAYWTRQLAGIKAFRVLPDRPRPAVPTTNGAIASIVFSRQLTNRAQALSGKHAATLFATALSALTATLSRYSGETEIVIGTQVSDRDQVELEAMIGQFVNSLILRNDLSGDPRFGDLIERSRDTIALALEHRNIPIERLLSMVKASRETANSALISVNFIFQRTFIQNADYGDFALVDMPSLPAGAIYDLNFFMVERPDGWRFSCQYNTDQFEGDTVYRLLRGVERILDAAVDNPRQRISELPLLDDAERRQILGAATASVAEYPRAATLASSFAEQAARVPEDIAVIAGDKRLNYRELETRANQLANYLLAQGVVPGQRIGICLDRDDMLPVAMLAVAKSGAAFVLFDPLGPAARFSAQAESAGLSMMLVGPGLRSPSQALPAGRLTRIDLGELKHQIARMSERAPDTAAGAEDEACVTFVGSSRLKASGIRLSNRALVARLSGLQRMPGLAAGDVFVATTSTAIDLSVMELLLPLICGARLVIASSRDSSDGARLLALMQRSHATVMHGLPAVWRALIAADWHGQPRIRVLCTGERGDRRLAAQLLDRCHELWSLHACPEATMVAAAHCVLPQDDGIPLGKPLDNTRLYVVDARNALLPPGAPGELLIGGDSLAMGLLADEAGEAQRFIADPFAAAPGSQLYRSGERARIRHNGAIEYLGRLDRRLTIGGHRIEPSDIEATLCRHPNIDEAAIVTTTTGPEPASFAAFVTTQHAAPAEELSTALADWLRQTLPAESIPAPIVALDTLPRGADNQVDSRALRSLLEAGPGAPRQKTAEPANDIEQRLVTLWKTMLGRDQVGTESNFFELGGHSLLAARMLGRVEAEFGRRISLAALFRAPSIHELAQLLERSDVRDFDFRQVVKLQPAGTRPPVIGINNTGIYYLLAKRLGADQPFTSLQLFDPSIKTDQLPKTLEAIAAEYVQLIRRVQPNGPYTLMGWCVAGALAFEVACQLDAQCGEVARIYLMDSWVPNYMRRLPRLRALIAEYSLRWQFILADWRKVRSRHLGLSAFLENRMLVKSLRRMLGREKRTAEIDTEHRQVTPEDYDQWLLGYLQQLTAAYEPKQFRGQITLFRSHGEPTGWWFDPNAGWGAFAAQGVDLHLVDGDHFTMFQEPGVAQMAEQITALVDAGLDH